MAQLMTKCQIVGLLCIFNKATDAATTTLPAIILNNYHVSLGQGLSILCQLFKNPVTQQFE